MKFSIIILTYNRYKELTACLDSIVKNSFAGQFEVIVIFNGDRSYLERCTQNYPKFSFHYIQKSTPAWARNFGVTKASGEYLFFLDDDCTLPIDYFSKVDFEKNWDVLGGPDQTPLNSSPFQKLTGEVLSSPLCTGPTFKRHTKSGKYLANSSERELILCNLWFKASLFKSENFQFNTQLFRNEENFLLKELKSKGKIIHYNPEMFVYRHRRGNLEGLGAAIVKSGECRVLNFLSQPSKKEVIYFLPFLGLLAFLWTAFHPQSVLLFLFATYALTVILYRAIFYSSFSLKNLFMHFFILGSYSIGLCKGLWKYLPIFYSNFKENRSFINESSSK